MKLTRCERAMSDRPGPLITADVHAALLDVVREQGGKDADDAQSWMADVTGDGRYLRDVY